jgi:hypothetical protein
MNDLERYLQALAADDPDGRFLEVRFRQPVGMGQRFVTAVDVAAAAAVIRALGTQSDTYVGVALRDRRSGRRDAVSRSRVLFVEVDADASALLLERAPKPPSMTVGSGSRGHLHAYWLLSEQVPGQVVKAANQKLAHRVGGDLASNDETRILRPPETRNFKHRPPRPVVLQELDATRVYDLAELVRGMEDPPTRTAAAPVRRAVTERRRIVPGDGSTAHALLRAIPTAEYVQRLAGLEANGEGNVSCPWHEDRTPSLHLYPDGEWCCFGCKRGGTVFDFAGQLWGLDTKGRDFVRLRARLTEELGVTPVRPAPRRARQPSVGSGEVAASDRTRMAAISTDYERGGR